MVVALRRCRCGRGLFAAGGEHILFAGACRAGGFDPQIGQHATARRIAQPCRARRCGRRLGGRLGLRRCGRWCAVARPVLFDAEARSVLWVELLDDGVQAMVFVGRRQRHIFDTLVGCSCGGGRILGRQRVSGAHVRQARVNRMRGEFRGHNHRGVSFDVAVGLGMERRRR